MNTQIIEFKGTEIYCPVDSNGQVYVAIKPICQSLGVNFSGQIQRIKRDQILSQLCVPMHTTGRDSKQYEMACLPLRFVFGWLFTIDENSVKPEAREQVLSYKMECYQILYDHFTGRVSRYKHRDQQILKLQDEVDKAEATRSQLGREIKDKKLKIREMLGQDPNQLEIFTDTDTDQPAALPLPQTTEELSHA
ncbi:MAG: phage antirepressor N-terminal domain-containing protein [Balneolales bacterium]|nr:phage antirepressor N-terminal domain-containing protein [Balneolales bacterium]